MEDNNDLDDQRLKNIRYGNQQQVKELLELERWIFRLMRTRNDNEIVMESSYLQEITATNIYIRLSPTDYCLYDFADEFLEEGGIEVSYNSNFIRFREIQNKDLRIGGRVGHIEGVYGLIAIGWGEVMISILKDDQIEILSNYKHSLHGLMVRFKSQLELINYIHHIRRKTYKFICQYANHLLEPKINQLDAIIIGLKRFIRKEEIDLNWFEKSIKEKISNIVEIDYSGKIGINQLKSHLEITD